MNRHFRSLLFCAFGSIFLGTPGTSFSVAETPLGGGGGGNSLPLGVERIESPSPFKRKSPTNPKSDSKPPGAVATNMVQLRIGVREPNKTVRIIKVQPSEGWRLPSSTSFPWTLRCNKKCTTYKTLKAVPTSGTSTKGTLTLQLQEVRADKSEVLLPKVVVLLPDGILQTAPEISDKPPEPPPLAGPVVVEPPLLAVGTKKLTPRLSFKPNLPWLAFTREPTSPPNPGEPGGATLVCSVNDNSWLPILVYPTETSAQQTVSCTYYGKEFVEISAIAIAGTHMSAFTIQGFPKTPFRLLSKQSFEFGVTFHPNPNQSLKALYNAHLTIQTKNAPYSIHLWGAQTSEDILVLKDRFWAYMSLDEVQIPPESQIRLFFSPQTQKEQQVVLYVAGSPTQLNHSLYVVPIQEAYNERLTPPYLERDSALNDADRSYPSTFGEVKKIVFHVETPTLEQGDKNWTYSLVFSKKTKIFLGVKRELSSDEKRQREFETFYQVFTEAQVGTGWAPRGTLERGQPESAPLFPTDSILRQDASLGTGMIGMGVRLRLGGKSHAVAFTLGMRLRYTGPSPHTLVQSLEIGIPEYCHFSSLMARSICIGSQLSVGMNQILEDSKSLSIATNSPVNFSMGASLPLRIQLMPRLHLVIEPTWSVTWYNSAASHPVNRWEVITRHGLVVPVGLQFVPKFW